MLAARFLLVFLQNAVSLFELFQHGLQQKEEGAESISFVIGLQNVGNGGGISIFGGSMLCAVLPLSVSSH